MLFGDSSVGQVYWDAAGVIVIALFAYRTVAPLSGFVPGLLAAMLPFVIVSCSGLPGGWSASGCRNSPPQG